MLLHDLKDVKNGRVITKDVISKDKYELVWQNEKYEIYEDENNEFELIRKSNKSVMGTTTL